MERDRYQINPDFMPQQLDINLGEAFVDLAKTHKREALLLTSASSLMATRDNKGWLAASGLAVTLGLIGWVAYRADKSQGEKHQKWVLKTYQKGQRLLDQENHSLRAIVARRDIKRLAKKNPDVTADQWTLFTGQHG